MIGKQLEFVTFFQLCLVDEVCIKRGTEKFCELRVADSLRNEGIHIFQRDVSEKVLDVRPDEPSLAAANRCIDERQSMRNATALYSANACPRFHDANYGGDAGPAFS